MKSIFALSLLFALFYWGCSDVGELGNPPHSSKKSANDDDPTEKAITQDSDESEKTNNDDGKPPPSVKDFEATASEKALGIDLSWTLPEDTTDVVRLKLLRRFGDSAPKDCEDGSGDVVFDSEDIELDSFEDEVEEAGFYSYRFCVVDGFDHFDTGEVVFEGVEAEPGCGGVLAAEACWYLGDFGASCTEVCTEHGGDHEATKTYTGTAGTREQCHEISKLLNAPGADKPLTGLDNTGQSSAWVGCHSKGNAQVVFSGNPNEQTKFEYKNFAFQRICACQN
jgi:hypothetical protein